MLSLTSQSVDRRRFLTAMAAASAAVGAAAVFAQEVTAAPVPASGDLSLRTHTSPTAEARQTNASATPTVVLVHGAFAESESWNGVIAELLAQGYPVVAAANPLRGVASDAQYVASILASIRGPIVLVGHSYGGMVISTAANGNANVTALVYVGAFAPDTGESATDLASRFPGSTLGAALAAPVALSGGGVDLYIDQSKFHQQFAADVPEAQAMRMAATQRPITEAALMEPSGQPAWRTIPSWSVYGSLDKNIPAAALAFMAERANAREVIAIEGASHVVMVSHPVAVTKLILDAAAG